MSHSYFKVNVSVVICKNDQFLLVKRADNEDAFPGYWGIPGGTVEVTDKTLEDALSRECMEEVGITVSNASLLSNNLRVKGDGSGTLYLVYKADFSSGNPQALDGTAKVSWLSIEKIQTLQLTPMTLEIIEQCR